MHGATFETQQDRARENETLALLCKEKGLTYKLNDRYNVVDAGLYKDDKLVAIAEVKTTHKIAYHDAKQAVYIALKKIYGLQKRSVEQRVPCCIVFRFKDCIGYFFLHELYDAVCGYTKRGRREGSLYDRELIILIRKEQFKII